MAEEIFEVGDISLYKKLCGKNDSTIRKIESLMGGEIIPRGNTLIVSASEEKREQIVRVLHLLGDFLQTRDASYEVEDFDLRYLCTSVLEGKRVRPTDLGRLRITIPESGKVITPRTMNQGRYLSSIEERPVTFGIGPAGTGKTYLAVVVALKYFLQGKVQRIVLTRPAVEAGESLGFLPGDLTQKINPYLRPLYDALFDLLSFEKVTRLIEEGSIEIAPLAYMRGRTLNNSFIILDEAQNTTRSQMKMFLTRLGGNSKFVITGDVTQIDIEKPKHSGLLHAMDILQGIKEIEFINFKKEDISRHPVVEKIVAAYDRKGHSE